LITVLVMLPRPDRHRRLHSFPTRRSSDLAVAQLQRPPGRGQHMEWRIDARTGTNAGHIHRDIAADHAGGFAIDIEAERVAADIQDRKSTRLNSSHVKISYAVFCLKKKNN